MNRSLAVFLTLFKRDIYAQRNQFKDYFINYCIVFPLISIFVFGYLQSNVFFDNVTPRVITTLLTGSALLIFLVVTYKHHITLLYDLEGDRFIEYQITLLNPRLVLLERILFTALLAFTISLPFYPLAKLCLQHNFDTSATCWSGLVIMLALSSLMCSAYSNFIACFLKSTSSLTHVWPRLNEPMMMLGGFWVPCYILWKFSYALGTVSLLNPLLYVTDGLRQAIVGGDQFLSLPQCALGLISFSCLFCILSWYYFKKRVDHI